MPISIYWEPLVLIYRCDDVLIKISNSGTGWFFEGVKGREENTPRQYTNITDAKAAAELWLGGPEVPWDTRKEMTLPLVESPLAAIILHDRDNFEWRVENMQNGRIVAQGGEIKRGTAKKAAEEALVSALHPTQNHGEK